MNEILVTLGGLLAITAIVWWFWLSSPKRRMPLTLTRPSKSVSKDGAYQPAAIEIACRQAAHVAFRAHRYHPCAEKVVFGRPWHQCRPADRQAARSSALPALTARRLRIYLPDGDVSRQADRHMIPWLHDNDSFPPLDTALREPNGLLAAGGDLSPAGCSPPTGTASSPGSVSA